jgi:cysteinyl-tRNA synthetase
MSDQASGETTGSDIATARKEIFQRSEARKEFFQEVAALGKRVGLGATALEELVTRVLAAACDSLIKPEDAKLIYHRYAKASATAGGTKASLKTNTSKIKKLIELGNHNDGRQLIAEADRLRKTVPNQKSLVEGLAQVSRELKKAKRLLNEDEIKTALTRAPPKAKAAPSSDSDVKALIATKDTGAMMAARNKLEADLNELNAAIAECSAPEIHEVKQAA